MNNNYLLWLLPLALVAALVALGFLGRSWKAQAKANLKTARGLLRQLQQQLDWAAAQMSAYSPHDPEPYGRRVSGIQSDIALSQNNFVKFNHQYVQLQEQAGSLSGFAGLLSALFPISWYQIQSQARSLVRELEAELERSAAARAQVEGLSRLGWETARQAREVFLVQQETRLLFERLRARGLRGSQFEGANERRRQVRAQLDQIPVFFLSADEEEVSGLAGREDIVAAHASLEEAKLELEEIIALGSDWESGSTAAGASVQAFGRSLAGTQRLLGSSAGLLDLQALDNRLAALQGRLFELQSFMEAPEVEGLEAVSPRAEQALAELEQIRGQIGASRQEFLTLQQAYRQGAGGLQEAAARLQVLASHPAYPLDPDLSGPRAAELQRQLDQLAARPDLRQPAALPGELAEAQLLYGQIGDLQSALDTLESQHDLLAGNLLDPALQAFETWLESARSLADRLQVYAAQNFAAEERVTDLPVRLTVLEQDWQGLRASTAAGPIPESDLAQRLAEAQTWLITRQEIGQQLERLQKQLVALEQEQASSLAVAEDVQAALGQIGFLVRSNPFLAGSATQQLASLQAEARNLGLVLGEQEQGRVTDKARLANSLAGRVYSAAGKWLEALAGDIQAMTQDLAAVLAEIEAIARVEEGVVDVARQVLLEAAAAVQKVLPMQQGAPLVLLVPEFKRRCDYWQRCVGVRKELQELAEPIKRGNAQAAGPRQQVLQALESASAWLGQRQNWPPTAVNLQQEQAELKQLDLRWQGLKSRPLRAIQLVQELGEIAAGYLALIEKVQARADQAEHEMRQAEEVEADLNELASLWQGQWYAYRDNPAASAEIKKLLDEIENSLKSIRNQYKRRRVDYEQAVAALKNLYRKVRFYQVELDASHALDAMGNIQSRR